MKHHLLICAAALLVSSPARSENGGDYRVRVGLGGQLQPKFKGADDTEVAPLFDIDIARGDQQFRFEAPDDSFGIRLISGERFSAGPAANIESSRKNSDVGAPVGKVPTTLEAGAFAEFQPSDSLRVRGELLKGIGGHKGLVGSVGGDYIVRDGDHYVFSVGPRLLFSSGRYQSAYFGVDSEAAIASGLPVYRPGAGIHAVALASGLTYQFSERVGMFGFGRFERLVGDAAKSPIVRELGSRNQLSGGLGLSYTFTVRR
ncbi:MAG: MipA/OmpV family protein [Sphingomicrobium sp.]